MTSSRSRRTDADDRGHLPHPVVRAMRRTMPVPLALVAAFALTIVIISEFAGPRTPGPAPTQAPTSIGPAEALVARYDCWQGDAPADMEGKIPGHVVVTRPGAGRPEHAGTVMVGRALEHVFEGRHPRLTVHAFCR